jgi:hypothetical protein
MSLANTKQPLHDSPDWFWPGGNPGDPNGPQPNEMHEASYVGEVTGGERDHLGQETPNGTGEMKMANGVLSTGTWIDGWIQEGTWTDTLADTKAAAEPGIVIWKTYTGTYQNGEPHTGTVTFTDGSTASITDGNYASIAASSKIHDADSDSIRDGI